MREGWKGEENVEGKGGGKRGQGRAKGDEEREKGGGEEREGEGGEGRERRGEGRGWEKERGGRKRGGVSREDWSYSELPLPIHCYSIRLLPLSVCPSHTVHLAYSDTCRPQRDTRETPQGL